MSGKSAKVIEFECRGCEFEQFDPTVSHLRSFLTLGQFLLSEREWQHEVREYRFE
jgi:hypothetical protein